MNQHEEYLNLIIEKSLLIRRVLKKIAQTLPVRVRRNLVSFPFREEKLRENNILK